jgi:hypothetical protein
MGENSRKRKSKAGLEQDINITRIRESSTDKTGHQYRDINDKDRKLARTILTKEASSQSTILKKNAMNEDFLLKS